jgi:hypothetical protein
VVKNSFIVNKLLEPVTRQKKANEIVVLIIIEALFKERQTD